MKLQFSKRTMRAGVVSALCAGLFAAGSVYSAQDEDAMQTGDGASTGGGAKPGASPAPGNAASGEGANPPDVSAQPPPADGDPSDMDDENPPKKPVPPAPQVQVDPVEPPLPTSGASDQDAESVPVPTNPELLKPFSEWDMSGIESPMFNTEGINEFSERSLSLTGKWSVKPHLSVSSIYDGNIFVQSNNTTSDYITRIEPGIMVRLGDGDSTFYMVGDYTAGANWYMDHPSESTVDQNAKFDFQWSLPKLTIGVHLGVLADTGSDIDATDRVKRQLYYAGVTTLCIQLEDVVGRERGLQQVGLLGLDFIEPGGGAGVHQL